MAENCSPESSVAIVVNDKCVDADDPLPTYFPAGFEPTFVVDTVTGTLGNGTETSITAAAKVWTHVTCKLLIIQNTGNVNCRIGATGVTTITGMQLRPGQVMIFDNPIPSGGDIYAVSEGAATTVLAQVVT